MAHEDDGDTAGFGFTEPLGPTGDAAAQLHELLQVYVRAGFTRAEAFDLVKSGLVESMRNQGA